MSPLNEHRAYLRKSFEPFFASIEDYDETELKVLKKYGAWLTALMRKQIDPITNEQKHFLKMCYGRVYPKTNTEKIWRKYRLDVLYRLALSMDAAISKNVFSYEEVRQVFEEIGQQGHKGAIAWLTDEGHDVEISNRPPMIDLTLDRIKIHKKGPDFMDAWHRASGSYGSSKS